MTNGPSIQTWLDQARAFASQGKYLHAVQVYQRITTEAPDVEAAWIELAHVYLHLHRTDAAERALLRALGSSRQPAQILYFLASLNRETGNRYEAMKYYRRLLEFERTLSTSLRVQLHVDLGMLSRERKNDRMAEYHLRAAHRIDPRYPRVNETLADLLLQRGALTDASRFVRRAMQVEPRSAGAHILLGRIQARREEWEAAYASFQAAVELDPEEPRGWQLCGSVLLALHRLEESERCLSKALALNPASVDALVDLGLVALRRDRFDEARELFMNALKVEPGNRRARDGQRELLRIRNQR